MEFSKSKILEIVSRQLAIDMNCNSEDFFNDGIVFCGRKTRMSASNKLLSFCKCPNWSKYRSFRRLCFIRVKESLV